MHRCHTLLLALLLLVAPLSHAQAPSQPPPPEGAQQESPPSAVTQLQLLNDIVLSSQQELTDLRRELQRTKDESEKQKITEAIDAVQLELRQLQYTLEKVATGGADLELFGAKASSEFDWRKEIEDVFQPIVVELRRLTERPRKIERLRGEQAYYRERLPVAEAALINVVKAKQDATTPTLKKQLDYLEDRWRRRRDELANRLKLVTLELDDMLSPRTDTGPGIAETLQNIVSGRGLDFVLALLAFATVFLLLRVANALYYRTVMRHAKRRRTLAARLFNLIFSVVTVLLSLFAAMAVLYVRGDWVILGLLGLLALAAVWAVKNSLPLYIKEAKLLLNVGTVREGERVIYNGLPWRVMALNLFTTLHNPALRGGTLRLSLDEIAGLHSRQFAEDEPWFPTDEGNYVLLDDATFGRVLIQTPEVVQLAVTGAIQTLPVGTFLDKNPKNLSKQGFGVSVKFGVDYSLQAGITSSVRQQFIDYVHNGLRADPIGEYLSDFLLEFDSAGASSLDFLILARFTGAAADKYFYARRLLQKLAVDACNTYGWSIPFAQVVVHPASPASSVPALAAGAAAAAVAPPKPA